MKVRYRGPLARIVVIGLIGVGAVPATVLAQQPANGADEGNATSHNWKGSSPQWLALRSVCHTDYQKLCAGTEPGGGRTLSCLKRNSGKLSPECSKAVLASSPSK